MVKRSFLRKRIGTFISRNIGTITGVLTGEKVVALTFDDGPHPEFTCRLLEILARYKAHATFFMVGKSVQIHDDVLEDVMRGGNAIGIHGWDHSSFVGKSILKQRKQIQSCAKVFEPYKSRIFRPPYGHQNIISHLNVRSMGYEVIGWDLEVGDWLFHNSASLAKALINKLHPGNIVLLHDAIHKEETGVNSNRESTLDAVDSLLEHLGDAMKFVTVPELFSYGAPKRENWYRN